MGEHEATDTPTSQQTTPDQELCELTLVFVTAFSSISVFLSRVRLLVQESGDESPSQAGAATCARTKCELAEVLGFVSGIHVRVLRLLGVNKSRRRRDERAMLAW
jgi:hypothetical protein